MRALAAVSRTIFHWILVVSVLCATTPAFADRKIASIRVAAPKTAVRKPDTTKFTAEDQLAVNRAFLDMLVRKYQMAQTFEAYKAEFARDRSISDADLRAIKLEYASGKERPRLHREKDSLIFELASEKFVVEWPDPLRLRVKLNGMSWTFNHHQAFQYQLALALKKLELTQGASDRSAILKILLPESRAIPVSAAPEAGVMIEDVGVAAGTAVVHATKGMIASLAKLFRNKVIDGVLVTGLTLAAAGAIGSSVSTLFCSAVAADTFFETKLNFCYDWRKQLDEATARRKDRLGKLDGLDKSKTEAEKKENLKYLPDADNMCAALRDKTKPNYVTDFRSMKRSAGDTFVPDGEWFSVVQYYHPDGTPDKFVVTPKGTDTADAQWMDKAKAVLTFDAGHLSAISYPNPAYQLNDPTSQPFLKQDVTTEDNLLTTEQRGRRDAMITLTKAIDSWTHVCGEINFVKSLEGHNVKVDNPNPSPQVTTPLKDVPAAQTPDNSSVISHITK